VFLAGCSHGLLLQDHSLAGRVWDVRPGAFVEAGKTTPSDYIADGAATAASFDFIWFTPRAARADPCARRLLH